MSNFFHSSLTGAILFMSVSTINAQPAEDVARRMPERWMYQPEFMQTTPSEDPWWKQYNDPILDSLIVKAEAMNYNVISAIKRIKLAERQIAAARSTLYPTVEVSAGWTRS